MFTILHVCMHFFIAYQARISNLKMVSKIIEKVVAVRLNRYLEENNLNEPLSSLHINSITAARTPLFAFKMTFFSP